MTEVKWIKIVTGIFDDEKILMIESLPEADGIIVIWFKILCLAGKLNSNGIFIMGNGIPYTDSMLSAIFRRKENLVKLALNTFKDFGMIEIIDNSITIPNWEKHQNLEKLQKQKKQSAARQKKFRQKQEQQLRNALCNGKITHTEIDKDKDIDIDVCSYEQTNFIPSGVFVCSSVESTAQAVEKNRLAEKKEDISATNQIASSQPVSEPNEEKSLSEIKFLELEEARKNPLWIYAVGIAKEKSKPDKYAAGIINNWNNNGILTEYDLIKRGELSSSKIQKQEHSYDVEKLLEYSMNKIPEVKKD